MFESRLTEFERIARIEKVQYLQEGGPDFESKLKGYKARLFENKGKK